MLTPVRRTTRTKHMHNLLPVLVYIEDHLDEPLTLDDLAALAGFSPHHFHRIFQREVAEAPKEYLRRLRLERSVYRLKVSPDNVLRIALEAGFKTHETFTRAFTRHFDIGPSEFRAVLKSYRDCVEENLDSYTFAGVSDETPIILKLDFRQDPLSVEKTPPQHVIFKRYTGTYESLDFENLWDEVIDFASERGLDFSTDMLIGITHDDPYVSGEGKARFDAGLIVSAPVTGDHRIGYRMLPPGLCVVRRHLGGFEEIAKTFSYIGLKWLLAEDYCLRAAVPFEIYHTTESNGKLERLYTDAYVPLDPLKRQDQRRL